MNESMNQEKSRSVLPTTLVVVVVIIVILLIVFGYLGKNAGNDQPDNSNNGTEITDAQREEIRQALESEEAPEITDEQRDEIRQALETEEATPELTEAQREEIRKALGNLIQFKFLKILTPVHRGEYF